MRYFTLNNWKVCEELGRLSYYKDLKRKIFERLEIISPNMSNVSKCSFFQKFKIMPSV